MGTQFWWFYDVLTISTAVGIIYAAVVKGFNKLVLSLISVVLAFVIAFFASTPLSQWAYGAIYEENLRQSIQPVFDEPLYELAVGYVQQSTLPDAPAEVDAALLADTAAAIASGEESPAWFAEGFGRTLEALVKKEVAWYDAPSFSENAEALAAIVTYVEEGDSAGAAHAIEHTYLKSAYLQMLRLATFLLLEIVVWILFAVIGKMAGNLEEQMHMLKGDKILAVPVGLLQAASVLIALTVVIRLVILWTDGQMLLFNEETVAETKLFQLLYNLLEIKEG